MPGQTGKYSQYHILSLSDFTATEHGVQTPGRRRAMLDPISVTADDVVARLMDEGVIGMKQAAKLCGTFRQGKPTRSGTIARWAMRGIKLEDGRLLKLESFRLNGRLCTSKQAIIRFIRAQNASTAAGAPETTTPAERSRTAATAAKRLDELGIK
jgi:hypothetical protein